MPATAGNPVWRTDPMPGYGFVVLLDKIVRGWFTECSGISVEREVIAYAEGGVNDHIHQLPGRVKAAHVTLKHGVAGNELWKWFQQGQYNGQVKQHHVSIAIINGSLIPLTLWNLLDAYPVKWSGPGLKTESGDVLVEEVQLAYEGSSGGSLGIGIQRKPDELSVSSQPQVDPTINLSALAAKVYALFQADLRVERERLGYK